jgi:hypothetical protein
MYNQYMTFDVQSGYIRLNATGENGVIKRKNGKTVRIPSAETFNKLSSEFRKSGNSDKLRRFSEEFPKVESGDTISVGEDTMISVVNSYNKEKDKPIEKPEYYSSKSITLWPGSEMRIGEVEAWDRTDAKTKKRFSGEKIGEVEIIKGIFNCSYAIDEDKVITPVAEIIFKKAGGFGLFDLYDGNLYCNPMASENLLLGNDSKGEVEFINTHTKKSYTIKTGGMVEIIVTADAIYKKSFVRMDKFFFDYNLVAPIKPEMISQGPLMVPETGDWQEISNAFETGMGSIEMFKNMSPDDLERLAKMGGNKVSEEQLKQFREFPEMAKMMEKEGLLKQMGKASVIVKGMAEGIGKEGMASMKRLSKDSAGQMEALSKKTFDMYKKAAKSPRNYGELSAEFKVA